MKSYTTDALRNAAIVGHGGTGKTSLADAILFNAKVSSRLGSVDDKTSHFDYDDEEKHRQLTIRATVGAVEWKNTKLNWIDTPGYDDFVGDVVASLEAADNAVLLVDAQAGVEVGTSRAWKFARERHIPSFIAVNKCDKEHSNFDKTYASVRDALGKRAVAVAIPGNEGVGFNTVIDIIGMRGLQYSGDGNGKPKVIDIPADLMDAAQAARESLIEQAAESDDALLEKYLEGNELSDKEVAAGLKKGVAARTFFPVLAMATKPNVGIDLMMDVMSVSGASPLDRPPVKAFEDEEVRKPSEDEPLAALAFKTLSAAHMGDLTFFRVFSGALESGSDPTNPRTGKSERIGQLYFTQGNSRVDAGKIIAGDIGAAVKLKDTHTSDTLCEHNGQFRITPIPFPKPVTSSAVHAVNSGDEDKVGSGLARLHEEDPTFIIEVNGETHQTLLHGLGEMQLDIVVHRLKERFNVEVELLRPKIAYRETIRKSAEGQGRYKKQSGGRGQFGDVWLRLEPLPRGEGFVFASEVVGGAVPTKFLPAVEKGVAGCMTDGVIAGCKVVDVKAVAYDGSHHSVDSSENSFKVAGSMAFKKVFKEASPVLLEPIMKITVTVPEDCMGDVMGDISSRRGKILGMEADGQYQVVNAEVPLAELYRYSTQLRSLSQGRGLYENSLSHYAEMPRDEAAKVIESAKTDTVEEA